MPSVPTPPDQQLQALLASHEMRLRAIETQQQMTYSNGTGLPVINAGLSPGSNPPQYGIQLVNPSNGQEIAFFGEDSSGNVGLTFRDGSGNLICRLDGTGLRIYNSAGTEEVLLGDLGGGAYGLEVLNSAGLLQKVSGTVVSSQGGLSTSATTPQAVSGTTVSATIGPSDQAMVTLTGNGEMNGPASGGGSAYFAVGVDGFAPTGPWSELQTNLAGTQLTAPISTSQLVHASQGTHTFQAYVWSDNTDHGAAVGSCYVIVDPL